jgi:hypothetical protein
MPLSAGIAANSFFKASKPPAEAPIPTTGNEGQPNLLAVAGVSADNGVVGGGAWVITAPVLAKSRTVLGILVDTRKDCADFMLVATCAQCVNGDEGDNPQLRPRLGAPEREQFVDARELQHPPVEPVTARRCDQPNDCLSRN